MSVVLVFVDGVGVGRRDAAVNPLAGVSSLLSHFDDGTGTPLPAGGAVARVDACLGVAGRPQSATGQATIFTGVNAAAHLGAHLCGFPNARLRELLAAESVFGKVVARGGRATFANAYPRPYLSYLDLPYDGPRALPMVVEPRLRRRLRPSASTCAASAHGPLRTLEDAAAGRALTHDLTGSTRTRHGFEIPRRSPAEAADVLLGLMGAHDFVLFEHFLLDEAGHAMDLPRAVELLTELDAFLRALARGLAPGDHLLVVSDHGNSEDCSSRSHTLNPVPLVVYGPRAAEVAGSARSLVDVTPWILALASAQAAPRLALPA
jgi:2,3-bisphosphoglycerate-independent phosphoglycerate mutase